MSQAQYTAIHTSRLIDLAAIPAHLLEQYVKTQPEWMQPNLRRLIGKVNQMTK
ncbi:hypothetical protein [Photobacterium leiognathi]|uniref:hypothetical protein n=1 Tax=Photobacterium leiognathi TaxID=553611 RepID=UPI00273A47D3|nr:hypothetical protein [Photobacterium leiognathi]